MKVPGVVVYHLCIVVLEDLEDPPSLAPTTIESFTFLFCATHATSGLNMAGKCSVSELHPQTVDSLCWIRLDVHHSQLRQTSTPQETQDPVHGHSEDR